MDESNQLVSVSGAEYQNIRHKKMLLEIELKRVVEAWQHGDPRILEEACKAAAKFLASKAV